MAVLFAQIGAKRLSSGGGSKAVGSGVTSGGPSVGITRAVSEWDIARAAPGRKVTGGVGGARKPDI